MVWPLKIIMSKESHNILLLTTEENFVWLSMQEIIPGIERCWKGLEKIDTQTPFRVEVFNVDQMKLSKVLKSFLQADTIVFTAFNFKLAKLAESLRKDFSLSTRFVFYLHGMTSMGCWPMLKFGMKDVFTKNDIFISTCHRDKETLELSFKESQVEVIPFGLDNLPQTFPEHIPDPKQALFVYIGRISEQKNLHTLIQAFSLVEQPFQLEIYGKEDGLGSPNMGIPAMEYQKWLEDLVKKLQLQDRVVFKGFVEREKLYQSLEGKSYCFISSSLHSDENFGMAVLRSLSQGQAAILSDWGGHHDFKHFFENQVFLTPVYKSLRGPFINPVDVKNKINDYLEASHHYHDENIKRYQLQEVAQTILEKVVLKSPNSKNLLKASPLALELLEAQEEFAEQKKNEDQSKGTKIFEDYADPYAHLFFESYGMINEVDVSLLKDQKDVVVSPWVDWKEDEAVVNDPHRGKIILRGSREQLKKQLFSLGYLFVQA